MISGNNGNEELGPNDVWWAGNNRATLTGIYENNGFMNEAHVHGFANRLHRTIVVIDCRKALLNVTKYMPGYNASKQIPMRQARELRGASGGSSGDHASVLWLLLSTDHWSALLPECASGVHVL